jgi:hypothetical protein
MPWSDLGKCLEALANFSTFAVSLLGSLVAAWWWRHRGSSLPRLKVNQSVVILPPESNYTSLYVTAHLENVGEVPIKLTKWCLWATKMLPLPQDIDTLLDTDPSRACRDYRLPWEAAAGNEFDIPKKDAPEIFPGETQDIAALLRVPSDIHLVRIYSHLPHESLAADRGWASITIVNMKEET